MRPEGAQIVLARSSGDPNVLCGKACAQRGAAGRTVVFQALRDIGTRLDSCLGFVTAAGSTEAAVIPSSVEPHSETPRGLSMYRSARHDARPGDSGGNNLARTGASRL